MTEIAVPNFSAACYALLKEYQAEKKTYIWITKSHEEAKQVYGLLTYFCDFVDDTSVNSSVVHTLAGREDDLTSALYLIHKKKNGIFILPEDFFAQLELGLSLIKKHIFTLKQAERMDPLECKRLLADLGYENSSEQIPGTMKGRGETLIIHTPENSTGYKIIFDESHIASIQDIETKNEVNAIDLYPLEPKRIYTDITKTVQNNSLGNYNFILVDLDRYLEETTDKILENAITTFSRLAQSPEYEHIDSGMTKKDFYTEINRRLKNHYSVHIAAYDLDILRHDLMVNNVPLDKIRLTFFHKYLEGFVDKHNKFYLLGEKDVSLTEKKKANINVDEFLRFIATLEPGDYVVHQDHGIGKYTGTQITEIDGYNRESIVIEFAHSDRLYLPIELAYKVDKYVGDRSPRVSSLTSRSWGIVTKKIKQDTLKVAQQLLRVQASRETAQVDPLKPYKEEKALAESFEYTLTPDQKKAIDDILNELQEPKVMDRLVVGDVGFGKTEVAMRAAYRAVLNGAQVAILAPTTILAQQHFDTFIKRFKPLGVNIAAMTRFTKKVGGTKNEQKILDDLKKGTVDIIIGTHRLLSRDVKFSNLGMVVIDEEQKFGVKAKEKLKQYRYKVHLLTLSATPIPRTLYLAITGLKNISTIKTPPKGRKAIETIVNHFDERSIAMAIQKELQRDGQVYYVYNDVARMDAEFARLKNILKEYNVSSKKRIVIDMLHGQMHPEQIANTIEHFDNGKIDILICSTIIENGIDMPNVNTLIVRSAQNFGLAQLHQLRGRIGRGNREAYAYMYYDRGKLKGLSLKRLQSLQRASDLGSGFEIANFDLEIRGIGNILGKQQHGHANTIGLSMYLQLLHQAISLIQTGEYEEVQSDISVDLPFEFSIPESITKSPEKRILQYHAASMQNTLEDLELYWKQTFKKTTAELENLKYIFETRILCQTIGIDEVNYWVNRPDFGIEQHFIRIHFRDSIDLQRYKLKGDIRYREKVLRLAIDTTNDSWKTALRSNLQILAKNS